MTDQELKPCPFCGGEAKLKHNDRTEQYWVSCSTCDFDGHMPIQYHFMAVKQWNTRSDNAEIPRLREALEFIQQCIAEDNNEADLQLMYDAMHEISRAALKGEVN